MKLSPSSSFLIAGLAISSSSSALAAPAGDSSGTMVSSTSFSRLHYPHQATRTTSPGTDTDGRNYSKPDSFDKRSGLGARAVTPPIDLGSLVVGIPVVGDILQQIVHAVFSAAPGLPDAAQNAVTPEQLQALQAAVGEVSRRLQSVPGGVAPIPGAPTAQAGPSNGPKPTPTSTASVQEPSHGSYPSSAPSSPPMPGNPPNSPAASNA